MSRNKAALAGLAGCLPSSYGSIKSILQNGLDKAYAKPAAPEAPPIQHANIRGRNYYH